MSSTAHSGTSASSAATTADTAIPPLSDVEIIVVALCATAFLFMAIAINLFLRGRKRERSRQRTMLGSKSNERLRTSDVELASSSTAASRGNERGHGRSSNNSIGAIHKSSSTNLAAQRATPIPAAALSRSGSRNDLRSVSGDSPSHPRRPFMAQTPTPSRSKSGLIMQQQANIVQQVQLVAGAKTSASARSVRQLERAMVNANVQGSHSRDINMLDMKALTAKSSSSRIPALSKAATRPVHNTVLLSDIVAAFQQKRSNDTGVDQRRTYVPEQKQATLWDKTLVDSESQGLEIPGFLQLNEVTDYVPGKSFAAGGGGSLYRGHMTVHALNGFKVVIKKMKGASLPAFRQEVALMWMFKDHENMVKLIGYDESQLAILMPEYPLGSLDHFIATKNYNLGIASSIAFDIAKGLAAMHARGIVHQDIKAPNVLLEEHPTKYVQAVITDFGISNVVEDKVLLVKAFEVKNMRGLTVKYAPPEAIIRFRSNDRCRLIPQVAKAGDVYSFSIVIHALLAKK